MATALWDDLSAGRPVLLPKVVTNPRRSALAILGSDVLACAIVVLTTLLACATFNPAYHIQLLSQLWPCLLLLPVAFALFGVYPGVVTNAVTEIRRTSAAITLVFAVLVGVLLNKHGMPLSQRAIVALCWLGLLFMIPLMRSLTRGYFSPRSWWGYPVIVFGGNSTGRKLIQLLKDQPSLGLKPVAVLDGTDRGTICGVPILGGFETGSLLALRLGITRAIVAVPCRDGFQLASFIESHVSIFPHVIIIPDLFGVASLGVEAADIGRTLTFTVRKSLLMRGPQLTKRLIDFVLALGGGILCLPFVLLIAALIRLETPGPALYRHTRIGKDGRRFRIWKFRSMVMDSEGVLRRYVAKNPDALLEWARDQKLRRDPRVTRVGMFLRKTSLDELPQLWNVLKGDMSLVGPRPIVEDEIAKYGATFLLYKQVIPGVTGLWQVSGRNDTGYTERLELDTYYIRNWSPWLDVYILARTIRVVLKRQGAY